MVIKHRFNASAIQQNKMLIKLIMLNNQVPSNTGEENITSHSIQPSVMTSPPYNFVLGKKICEFVVNENFKGKLHVFRAA